MMDFIPQIEPWIDANELYHLKRVVDSTYVVENVLTKEFEEMVRKHTGAKHAIAMTNGTMALYCCLLSMGLKKDDEVIVPNMTFIATANAVIMAGGKPVFCDIEKDTLCIDPKEIEKLITKKTKVIIPVHLYGNSVKIEEILKIAKKNDLKVLEDAAQGVGVFYNKQHVGTFGDCGILSYYGNKTITCGEGGVVLTNDDELAVKCYRLKNHGREKKGIFIHDYVGFNFSFTEMQAAIGISQMEKLHLIINKKKLIQDTYVKELTGVGDIEFQQFLPQATPVHWFTSFFTGKKQELAKHLLTQNIQTRDFFYPLNLQPCYKDLKNTQNEYPVSIAAYERGLSLPSSYNLTEEQQNYIIKNIKNKFKKS